MWEAEKDAECATMACAIHAAFCETFCAAFNAADCRPESPNQLPTKRNQSFNYKVITTINFRAFLNLSDQ